MGIRAIHTGGCRYRYSTIYEHHENFQILRTDSYKDFMVVTHAYKSCTVKRQAKIKQRIVQKYGSFCYRATKVYFPLKVQICLHPFLLFDLCLQKLRNLAKV